METKKLSKDAYGGVHGKDYVPYITDKSRKGVNGAVLFIGLALAIIFAASTAYSGMKAGLTVAAGIPGSIIGSAFVAALAKQKGILGKNIVQGMASGGESVASGMIFVLPAIILIGSEVSFLKGTIVGIAGVLFGIGACSLVHNYLIIEEHGKLMYPESMAISETLVASDVGGDSVKFMGIGFGIGGVLTVLTGSFLNVCNNIISFVGNKFYKYKFEVEVNPLLLGIGFIVGLPVALQMFAGSVLSNFGVIPLIGYFSGMAAEGHSVWNDAALGISQMDVNAIAGSYVKYIGAGMMLCGGIIGALKLIPTIITSVKETMKAKNIASGESETPKLQKLLIPLGLVVLGAGAFIISNGLSMVIVGVIVSVLLASVFVIVSGRLTGTIGTSNLPVSGMTIASLVIITLVFVMLGWKGTEDNSSLLLFAVFIVTAISIAGGYAQSQKTTYIIGGNKGEMQSAFTLAGVIGVVIVVGVISILANQLAIQGDNPPFALPQANLMSTLTSGITSGQLPWIMIIIGVVIAFFMFLLNLPVMTLAIGFYLPISTTTIILIGALVRAYVEKITKDEILREIRVSNGVSLSSGLVAGGSIIGLVGIILQITGVIGGSVPSGFAAGNGMGFILLILLIIASTLPLISSKVKK